MFTITSKKSIAMICAAVVVLAGIVAGLKITQPYALTADGEKVNSAYTVCIDGEEVALVASKEEGQQVVEDITNYYVTDDATVENIEVKQEVTVEKAKLDRGINVEHPEVGTTEEVVDFIMTGVEDKKTYTVEKGDTAWDIAEKNDVTLDELEDWNKDSDLSMLSAGDEVNLYAAEPLVDVTTVETVTYTKKIKYDTKVIETADLYDGETKVKTEGKNGSKEITATVVKENGETVDKDILNTEVTKKPVTKVVYKGTKPTGSSVASFALQFVGNPYVYGGSSLTNGADCSGFVMAVYAHFGYSLPHSSYAQQNCGRHVSYSEAKPGDIICYGSHVGIYIGGGMIVHAMNQRMGITVSGANFMHIVDVRRIIG